MYDFSDIVCLCANHGDRELNRRILRKLGYSEYYNNINKDFHNNCHHYVCVNMSASVPNSLMRVCTNLFRESSKYVEFY